MYKTLSSFDRLPVLRSGEWLHITDSHDVTGGNNDGFSSAYSYLYQWNSEWVLLDVHGPGCVYLLRTAMFTGTLKVYLDGNSSAAYILTFDELYKGARFPFIQPFVADKLQSHGSEWSFIPIPFTGGCKITAVNEPQSGPHFYNIWCKLVRDAEQVNCSKSEPEREQDLMRAANCWTSELARPHVQEGSQLARYTGSVHLSGWSTQPLFVHTGAGTVNSIKLYLPSTATSDCLSNIRIRAYWDHLSSPCADAPIGMFFGIGKLLRSEWNQEPQVTHRSEDDQCPVLEGMVAAKSLFFGEDEEGAYYCVFPMPFWQKARIELVNTSALDAGHWRYEILTSDKVFEQNAGYFCAYYRSEEGLLEREDYTIAAVRGRGHYLGCVLSAQSRQFTHELKDKCIQRLYLEGDARFYVDDSRSMLVAGTGTEEYFNWGWYDAARHDHPFSMPTHGYTTHRLETQDYTCMYRVHPTEFVSFYRSFRFDLEHGPVSEVPADYASVAFYYWRPEESLHMTDEISPCDARSEQAHNYEGNGIVWEGELSIPYEGNGQWAPVGDKRLTGHEEAMNQKLRSLTGLQDRGRAWDQYCEFTATILTANTGVKLRRRGYYGWAGLLGEGNQENKQQVVKVVVDGQYAGLWAVSPSHARDTWVDHDFEIHPRYTSGKQELRIRLEAVNETIWNEFRYWVFAYQDVAAG